jgi:hypothetical protein
MKIPDSEYLYQFIGIAMPRTIERKSVRMAQMARIGKVNLHFRHVPSLAITDTLYGSSHGHSSCT